MRIRIPQAMGIFGEVESEASNLHLGHFLEWQDGLNT